MTDVIAVRLPPNQFQHFYRGGDRIGALRGGPGGPMRPEEWIGSTITRFGYFRADLLPGAGELAAGFSIVLVLDGDGRLATEHGGPLSVRRGDAAVVPWAAGRWWVDGVAVIACRPPLPEAAAGAR